MRAFGVKDDKKEIMVDPEMKEDKMELARVTDMIGYEVKNLDGEELGKIDNIIVDITKGDFTYAVVSTGGFLGLGNKLVAVPWNVLTFDSGDDYFTLKIHHSKLENAPGVNADDWHGMKSEKWTTAFMNYYNLTEGYLSGHSKDLVGQEIDGERCKNIPKKHNL